ncbi:adhesin [Pseudomonas sp. BIGb0427]|uniref:CS1 type fimbrial major subunit n=1 Tax=unclassified Pseudomonas TaxID=196821 RepID=UPI0018A6E3CC|nr:MULTISPECIES: CS1 type fimbrial major subunit [unclassified Pseudomonas]QPG62803.1 adhesin [Pseudomonas sp. BIGb0427]UVM65210.1 fimbrial protein [Pseudomonas sp. B21-009]
MKRTFLALPLALLAVGNVFAADALEKQVTVTATVPTENFYVEPVGGNWMNEPQNMAWNALRESLEPINKQLQVKSTTGAISARLLSPAVINSGANSIGLDVAVNGTGLTTTSTPVVPAAAAAAGSRISFDIAARSAGAGGYVPGNYQGIVSMLFETVSP